VVDRLTKEKRSWNMSRIRSSNTKPELIVRQVLHAIGYRFRLHRHDLPGKPDIVLPKYKTVIFVHGCFWHRHEDCKYAYNPKSRVEFWQEKFRSNIERDKRVSEQIAVAGWRQLTIWECETKKLDVLSNTLTDFLHDKHL
jgi:DNA mismatch endonuclease (patch repair protein)